MSYGDAFVNGLVWGMVGTSIVWLVILLVAALAS